MRVLDIWKIIYLRITRDLERFKIIIDGCVLAGDSDWDADRRIAPSGISDSGDRRDLGVVYIKTAVKSEKAIKNIRITKEKNIMKIRNLENENRKVIKSVDNFHVLEYVKDASVSPMNAADEYFMSQMNVRRRQVVIDLSKDHSAIIQAGAMQWMGGNVQATTGVKGIGDLFGKAIKGAVTKESAVKPEYVGEG